MNKFNYNISRPYPVFAEGGGAGGAMRRTGFMDQTKKESKPQHNLESALFDVGKFALNSLATPLETISGRNFYDPEFSYSGMDKADAISSGITSAATDIAGTYFLGPFYTGGKKLIQGGVNKMDPDNSWDNTNSQVTAHGGEAVYKIGNRDYKTRGRVAGNVRRYNAGGMAGFDPSMLMNAVGGNGGGFDLSSLMGGGGSGNSAADLMGLLGGSPTGQMNSGQGGAGLMSDMTSLLGGSSKSQNIMSQYGQASTDINPNTIDADKGNTREWEGFDGGLINTWTSNTPQQEAALSGLEEGRNWANEHDKRTVNYHSQEGNKEGVTGNKNYMQNALINNLQSKTHVGNDTWNKIGTTISKVGNLASNFVGGPQGTQLGGNFGKAVQGYNNMQSGFDASNFSGNWDAGKSLSQNVGNQPLFDFNQFGGQSGDGKFLGGMDLKSLFSGGGGGGFDMKNIGQYFGMNAPGSVEHGGDIKNKDMKTKLYYNGANVRKYGYGEDVQSDGYKTESTLPKGVTWDGNQYNVSPDANTTFEIEEGNTHENGGTFMNVPAEGEGNTTIEAEKGEVADVENNETYIWSKNKVPGTNLTFAKRKLNRDTKANKIEKELESLTAGNNDEYRKNTLMRQLMLLEVEENSDKDLQGNIKRKKELKERIDLDNLLLGNTAIAKNGSYVKNGKRKKLTAFQESIYDNTIMRMGTEVRYEEGGNVKPKKPRRPFGTPSSMDYQKKMRDYKKAMKKYQADMTAWQKSQTKSNTTETSTADTDSTGTENIYPQTKDANTVDLSDMKSTSTEDIFDVQENNGKWEYKVNGKTVSAEEYDKSITDYEADPAGFATVPYAAGTLNLEKNQTGAPISDQSDVLPDDLSENQMVPEYNAEGVLTGFKNPNQTREPIEPINLPPKDVEPINNQPTEDAQSLEGAAIPPDLQLEMDQRAQQIANNKKQAAQNYDVPEESLIYNDKGQLVPEVGTKSNTYGDTWGENGWNDDAPEKRQNEILSNLDSELSPNNIKERPNQNKEDVIEDANLPVTEVPEKSLDNVVVKDNNSETSESDTPSAAATDLFNKGEGFEYNKKNTTPSTTDNTSEEKATDGGGDGNEKDKGDGPKLVDGNKNTDNTNNNTVVEEDNNKKETVDEVSKKGIVPNEKPTIFQQQTTNTPFQSFYAQGFGKSPYDWLGDAGLIYGAQAGINNTKKFWDEYQGLPNENFWEGVGDRRERRLNNNLGIIDASRKNTKRDLRQDLNTILRGNRNTASSFGNLNARDQNAFNTYAQNSVDADIKYGLMNLDKQGDIAAAEFESDKLKGKGDWEVRNADQQDLAGYYTQLGADKQNIAKNMMELAKNKNTGYASMLQGNSLNSMGGFRFDKDGNLIPGNNTTNNNKESITNNYFYYGPNGEKIPMDGPPTPPNNTPPVDETPIDETIPNENPPNQNPPEEVITTPEEGDPNATPPGENTSSYYNINTGNNFATNFSGDYEPGTAGHFQEFARGMNLDLGDFGKSGTEWEGVDNNIGKYTTAAWDVSSNAYRDYLEREGKLEGITGITEPADLGGTNLPFRRKLSPDAGQYTQSTKFGKFDNPQEYYASLTEMEQNLLKEKDPETFGEFKNGGRISKMMYAYGNKVKKYPYGYGTKVKKYDDGNHVHPHEEPISDNVRQDYHDLYGKNGAGMKKRHINNMLNTMNPSTGDTLFIQPHFQNNEIIEDGNQAITSMPNSDKQRNMMMNFMMDNYTEDSDGKEYTMNFTEPFTSLFNSLEGGDKKMEHSNKGGKGIMSSKVPLKENYNEASKLGNLDKAIEFATPTEVKNHGGLVNYFMSERDKNRKNNRNLADQRISEFQKFMKNRK